MENYSSLIKNIVSKYQTNKIYVLGKGPSVGKIKKQQLTDGIVININDSERFFAGQFCLVHSLWALKSVEANGFKAACYFTSRELPANVHGSRLNYIPETYESIRKTIVNIENGKFELTDFLFIPAIKLALLIASILHKKVDVYFLGFDFFVSGNRVVTDFSNHFPEYTEMMLKTQESVFKSIKQHFINHQKINVIHVGNRQYSNLSVMAFNQQGKNISAKKYTEENTKYYNGLLEKIADGQPVVVAELTNNHIGDEGRLRSMIRLSKEAGADAIKVQKRDVNTFYLPEELNSYYVSPFGNTLKEYRERVELNDYLFDVLREECVKNEIFWYSSVLDIESFNYLRKFDLPLLKLPSTISNHRNFIAYVEKYHKKDIVVSTGFTDQLYEDYILKTFLPGRRLFLLQCTSSYPTPPEACNVAVVKHYSELKNNKSNELIPGYSSHDVGALACQLAVAAGALMIEKHVKLGNLDWVHFDGVALDLTSPDFRNFVRDIKRARIICGSPKKKIMPNEDHKYNTNKLNN